MLIVCLCIISFIPASDLAKYYAFTLILPSAAKYYANTLQTSAKRVYSLFAECS